jgi:hypothetical protein
MEFPGNESCLNCPEDCTVRCPVDKGFPYTAVLAPLGIIITGGATLTFFWRQRRSRRVDDLEKLKDEPIKEQIKPTNIPAAYSG